MLRCSLLIAVVCIGLSSFGATGKHVPEPSPATIAARAFIITDPEALAPFAFDRVLAALSPTAAAAWMEIITATNTHSPPQPVLVPLAGFIATNDSRWRLAGAAERFPVRPVAIANRFDLAPADYSHCGEYRLTFSQRTGQRSRLNIAIETALPNPYPSKGKAGCLAVAAFWSELARTASATDRRDQLVNLFFRGFASFAPILDPKTFASSGRIRTSVISDSRPLFAQFELKNDCAIAHRCVPQLTRVPLDNMPDAALFDANTADERAASFRREFARQVASLSIPDVNRYTMQIARSYSVGDVGTSAPRFNYQLPFRRARQTPAGRKFRELIADELRKAGSPLMPEDVIGRAETQNCAGCHGKPGHVGGDLMFPNALEQGEHIGVQTHSPEENARLSPALQNVFLPYRIRVLRQYLHDIAQSQNGESLSRNERCDGPH